MHDDYLPDLARIGVRAVSTFGARAEPNPYPGLLQINCHIDPINWRGDRGLVSEGEIIAGTIAHIESRIEGREDNIEPLGYLTHHLVHTEEIWAFTYKFLNELLDGGAESEPLSCFLEQKS